MSAVTTEQEARRPFIVMIVIIAMGQFIAVMNANVVTTAMPAILTELGATPVEASWAMISTVLANTVTTPIWARLGDRYNPIMLLRVSIVTYILAALIVGLSVSPLMLILSRGLQGVALGGAFSLGLIILANITSPRERGKYFGWISAITLTGQLTGPFIGGLLVQSVLGWRSCFFVVLPITVLMLVLLPFALRIQRERDPGAPRINWLGASLLAISIVSIEVWLSFASDAFGFLSWQTAVMLGGGVVVLVAALVIEWRSPNPVLPLHLLRRRVPLLAAIAVAAVGVVNFPIALFVSMYFQLGRGLTPVVSGLLLISTAVGSVAAAFLVGQLASRTGRLRRFLLPGVIVLTVGVGALGLTMGPETPLPLLIALLFVLGVGQGATMQFILLAAQNDVGLDQVGAVSGFMTFVQLLFGTALTALFGAVLNRRLVELQAGGLSEAEAYGTAVPEIFHYLLIAAVVAVVAIALLPRIQLRRTIDAPAPPPSDDEPAAAGGPAPQTAA